MSHFAVLVVTPKEPTREELEAILLPWHEAESTGYTEYTEWVDSTKEVDTAWENETVEQYTHADGRVYSGDEGVFYRRPTAEEKEKMGPHCFGSGSSGGIVYASKDWGDGLGYTARVWAVPDGWARIEVPVSKCYASREVYAKAWFGYTPIPDKPGRFGRLTNPNAKWDWWQVGGRYSNRLITKDGTSCNDRLVGDLDMDRMLKARREAYAKDYDALEDAYNKANKVVGRTFSASIARYKEILAELRAGIDLKNGPPVYELVTANPEAAELRNSLCRIWDIDLMAPTREEYTDQGRVISCYAYVKDGVWHGKGKMGWWGMSSGDADEKAWQAEIGSMVAGLRPTDYLIIVDCHI